MLDDSTIDIPNCNSYFCVVSSSNFEGFYSFGITVKNL